MTRWFYVGGRSCTWTVRICHLQLTSSELNLIVFSWGAVNKRNMEHHDKFHTER